MTLRYFFIYNHIVEIMVAGFYHINKFGDKKKQMKEKKKKIMKVLWVMFHQNNCFMPTKYEHLTEL